ncbi:hypothetical protein [Terasakiella sp. SH-1]|uniref:hypothetical protein n=1 Tax=Terasakiella sp. SH-1 TaxID=2560057 RepID=UPI0010739FC1|nr:hypothetical protein [Terasakiella sp. SH-1]
MALNERIKSQLDVMQKAVQAAHTKSNSTTNSDPQKIAEEAKRRRARFEEGMQEHLTVQEHALEELRKRQARQKEVDEITLKAQQEYDEAKQSMLALQDQLTNASQRMAVAEHMLASLKGDEIPVKKASA